ncbi:MAG: circadian clock protein KaiC [Moorella sp. (in: firmicutes)]|nr:circadian clock protein KaiC [Moorella sp. (in: firmicutes)]
MDKLKTGIKNLDHILDGGIPIYSLNIISGSPGSGKTIFVQNIIFNSARNGLKSLYLTTISESQFKMVRHLQEFEFFSDDLLDDKVIYGDLGAVLRNQGTDKVLGYLTDMIKKHLPNIVVIDSFKAIRDIFPDEKAFKAFVFDLAAALSIWEVTGKRQIQPTLAPIASIGDNPP